MLATDRQVSREARTVPPLPIGRKIGPASIPAASSQSVEIGLSLIVSTVLAIMLGIALSIPINLSGANGPSPHRVRGWKRRRARTGSAVALGEDAITRCPSCAHGRT
jgi:hypothetical protein